MTPTSFLVGWGTKALILESSACVTFFTAAPQGAAAHVPCNLHLALLACHGVLELPEGLHGV